MDHYQINTLNTVETVQLEIVSPLHVGAAGEKLWIQNIDYFYNGEEVIIFDQSKLIRTLAKAFTPNGTAALSAYQNLLASNRNWEIEQFLEECGIAPFDIAKKEYAVSNAPASEIRPLIRTGVGQAIIPGSSIKGAIRSTIFHTLFKKFKPEEYRVDQTLFGDIGNNIMKFIRPFDAVCNQTGLINCELFNLYQNYGNWESDYKQQFLISAEVFLPSANTSFRLAIADGLMSILKKEGNRISKYLTPRYIDNVVKTDRPVQFLFKLINNYTRVHLEREIAFFKKYDQAEDTEYIIDNLESYLAYTQDENQCLLRMAYGSGFHGITGDWRFSDHTSTILRPDSKNKTWNATSRSKEPARYKSRKITGLDVDATLMGFVKLKI